MKHDHKLWIILSGLIVILLAAGCAGIEAGTPTSPSDRGLDPVAKGDSLLPEGVALSYQRSGGIAGINETWLVYEDGRIEGPGELKATADPAAVEQLLADLDNSGLFTLEPEFESENPCCDRYNYVLTVRSEEGTWQMMAVEGAENVPAEVWESLELVEVFLDRYAA